jgi:hypothetical protein
LIHLELKELDLKWAEWKKSEDAKRGKSNKDRKPIPTWTEWKKGAQEERQRLIKDAENGDSLDFESDKWKALKSVFKSFLKHLFHSKCAYCEGKFLDGTPMDLDHYRPKAKVTYVDRFDDSMKTVKIVDAGGNETDHPGYYWLTCEPGNLLLSCETCNRSSKKTHFPIRGIRASGPEDPLEDEKPLLLNPYDEKKPEDHFAFGIKGFITGKTERGRETIEICKLDRETLQTSRQEKWEEVKAMHFLGWLQGEDSRVVPDEMGYSAYLRATLNRYIEEK